MEFYRIYQWENKGYMFSRLEDAAHYGESENVTSHDFPLGVYVLQEHTSNGWETLAVFLPNQFAKLVDYANMECWDSDDVGYRIETFSGENKLDSFEI